MFPSLEININKLQENAKNLIALADKCGIKLSLVTKVLSGNQKIVSKLYHLGFSHLADSRVENLIKYRHIPIPKILLRLPMASEAGRVVRYADISLNSELATIQKLNEAARIQKKKHGIILMFDLGDLREGIFYREDYLPIIESILKLDHISLEGIGTNLTCYGGIIPTPENLKELLAIKDQIENSFNIQINIISGGNSSSLYLLENKEIPKGINNLRIGEALFLGRETAYGKIISGLYSDCFLLKAEIIEAKKKPSYPIGSMGMDAFGNIPKIKDQGLMERGILALGKQDVDFNNLIPLDNIIQILGGSSDHLIIQMTPDYHVGDIITFAMNYPGLLQLMTSKYIHKNYIRKGKV
ncbi:MAG: alanine/ornithine racemase family PLP-dependent enzyme [Acholeplasmataceae bacterium]|nr:alanine/ornithine racemase family PLP-dependent enzyme [Acholeplasmataceae bacterium]